MPPMGMRQFVDRLSVAFDSRLMQAVIRCSTLLVQKSRRVSVFNLKCAASKPAAHSHLTLLSVQHHPENRTPQVRLSQAIALYLLPTVDQ